MPFFDDVGFYKRAQITASDLVHAGLARFTDIDALTIFADNLVPHADPRQLAVEPWRGRTVPGRSPPSDPDGLLLAGHTGRSRPGSGLVGDRIDE